MTRSSARATFLADQWAAASVELRDAFPGVDLHAAASTDDFERIAASPAARRAWLRFVDQLRAGETRPCAHLSGAAPGLVCWTSMRPAVLSCFLCVVAFGATVPAADLEGDHQCGACDQTTDAASAVTVDVGYLRVFAMVCPACSRPVRTS
jgi:hypothetical protein